LFLGIIFELAPVLLVIVQRGATEKLERLMAVLEIRSVAITPIIAIIAIE
jgi:hypothetical protein